MKRILAFLAAVLLSAGCLALSAFAEEALSAEVYVTVADKGALKVAHEKVTVTDSDGDGALTVNDALYAAHEANYEGGAAAGYSSYVHESYGLSLGKLWGDESGNFGYYVNNTSAWSLADPVKDGDAVTAFVYADGEYYSDTYCFFDVNTVETSAGTAFSLTLSMAGYDAEWNPVTLPAEGAVITVNGEATEVKTDAEGKATLVLDAAGAFVISASSDTLTLVPPVCLVTVAGAEEDTSSEEVQAGDTGIAVFAFLAVLTVYGTVAVCRKRA